MEKKMKLLFNNKTVWGWTMTGVLGKNRTWFFGFSSVTNGTEKGMKATIHRLRTMAEERKDDGVMLVVQAAERYEFIRTMPPIRFAELFQESLRGKLSFDQIIDREMQARS